MSETPTDDDGGALVDVTVTCRTDGCPSNGKAVPMTVPEEVSGFRCGACGNEITDVVADEGGALPKGFTP